MLSDDAIVALFVIPNKSELSSLCSFTKCSWLCCEVHMKGSGLLGGGTDRQTFPIKFKFSNTVKIWQSILSVIPPCPGMIVAKSFHI